MPQMISYWDEVDEQAYFEIAQDFSDWNSERIIRFLTALNLCNIALNLAVTPTTKARGARENDLTPKGKGGAYAHSRLNTAHCRPSELKRTAPG